ncbi:TnsA endonuclease N-terminal domain-containing protein [Paracoccus alkanivorans]|uniref:TnsA endonuclease N-terminal domain-containing protein n=1 Tax=Paracoccus alkanivorans TaxID=2116655 RepID=A0A3M0MIG8_9RHOB|nr:TnsA endonuclease N-terminal domain-containing protein [Paracoccus alkanivorans]RMC37438.1 hypothetical protein C9E81_01405 [Paracoccus alkanivorans]
MVAKLPGFARPRIIQFESALEYAFLCLMLVRDDIHSIWDQPTEISYTDQDGTKRSHVFDFLVVLVTGERIAVAIKPSKRVVQRSFLSELELVAAAVTKQFADRVLLITERHLDRKAAADAARQLAYSRAALTEVAA